MQRLKKLSLVALFLCLFVAPPLQAETEEIGGQSSIEGLTKREIIKLTRLSAKKKPKNNLAKVCKNVSNLNGLLLKVTAGGHISRNDPRYPGYSIICASKCVPFPATVYHCDGSVAFKVGYYGKWSGNGKSRGYCGSGGAGVCYTSSVRNKSRQLKCNGAGYLDVDGSRGKACMRFNLNSSRNGGV